MEMVFMERLALLRNSCIILFTIFLSACREKDLDFYDEAVTKLQFVNGCAEYKGAPFTGRWYRMAANKHDTLYCLDYRDGKADGRHVYWYENGRIQTERFYNEGRKEGVHESFWPDGSLRFHFQYKADYYEGTQYEWYENGHTASVKIYRNGKEDGLQQTFTPEGKLFSNYEAKNGRNYGNIGTKHCTPAAIGPAS